MPREHFGSEHIFLDKSEILSYEEIMKITSAMLPLGLRKLRITGGEPLVRKDLSNLIEMLRSLDSNLDIALTTNGILLARYARKLKEAGLNRVTISFDAMETDVFQHMGDTTHRPDEVVEGIDAALKAGLGVKINTVVQRNVNENQLGKIALMAHKRDIIPRFIEFMDVGTTNQWNLDSVVSGEEIREILSESIGALKPVKSDHPSDVAKRWKTNDGQHIGLIQSVTSPFCGDCSRARLSANGSMYTCLFATKGNDLRSLLRMDANEFDLQEAVSAIWSKRNDRYSDERTQSTHSSRKVEMSFIGG